MKRLFLFVLVFGCVATVTAQERVLDKAEFDAVVNGGYDHRTRWQGEKYRMIVTTLSTVTGRPQTDHSSKNVTEFGPSMETRTIYTSVFGGNPAPPKESLRIGNWLYTRSGSEVWTRKEYVAPPSAPAKQGDDNSRKVLTSTAEYKYLGQGKLAGRPVHVYVKTERRTTLNEKSGETADNETKHTYSIDGKGVVLKSEFTSEYRGKNAMQSVVIMEWELDPSITFMVPEIVP